jgi:hypothetical protein
MLIEGFDQPNQGEDILYKNFLRNHKFTLIMTR